MVPVKERPSYQLVQLVFSKEEPFTLAEICEELINIKPPMDKAEVESRLKRLRDAGVLVEIGSQYLRTDALARHSCAE